MDVAADIAYISQCIAQNELVLIEEKENSSNKHPKSNKFCRVAQPDRKEYVTTTNSPGGYLVCRKCRRIFRSGPKGGKTKEILKHYCHINVALPENRSGATNALSFKNKTERERKHEISSLIKDAAELLQVENSERLQDLTRARLLRAYLTEIPETLIQFCCDGKTSKEREPDFYDQLIAVLGALLARAIREKEEICERGKILSDERELQRWQPSELHNTVPATNATPPNLHLGLCYPAEGDSSIDISWVPNDVNVSLGFNRINIIGRNLEEIVHPEDYIEVVETLLQDRAEKDFSFPNCRITEPIMNSRSNFVAEYKFVFLTGYIKPCKRICRKFKLVGMENYDMPTELEMSITSKGGAPWPRLMAYFFHVSTYYQYMTLHAIDGRILQVDKRITSVLGYSCEEVLNKPGNEFILDDYTMLIRQAHQRWISNMGDSTISYPLKGKLEGSIVYMKSRGEFVSYRDLHTGELLRGFILNNFLIDQQECEEDLRSLMEQFNGSSCPALTAPIPRGDSYQSATTENFDNSSHSAYGNEKYLLHLQHVFSPGRSLNEMDQDASTSL